MPSPSRPKVKVKVKTGCRTCKTRKVKCDEARPSCQRCLSSGRTCEGYGIWDRPARHPSQDALVRIDPVQSPSPAQRSLSPLPSCNVQERQYLDWFVSRTAPKLPGTFLSSFWTSLFLRATISEHAVFHAVLALACLHKDGSYGGETDRPAPLASQKERFALQHYLQSIDHLKAHFSSTDRSCVRVVLISCIAFICLDFMRDNFESGLSHLRSGLRVLGNAYHQPSQHNGTIPLTYHETMDDQWILEIYARLKFMVNLFPGAYRSDGYAINLEPIRRGTATPVFFRLTDAWKDLQNLFDRIITLQTYPSPMLQSGHSPHKISCPDLLGKQEAILAELVQWIQAFQNFMDQELSLAADDTHKVCQILYAFHHMATIMANVSIRTDGAMAYDTQLQLFVFLMQRACKLRALIPPHNDKQASAESVDHTHEYLSDVGWIAPLCYTAIHCRNHRIRHQAIRLIASSCHREGMWDSKIMACVSKQIVALEERDFYKDCRGSDDFDLTIPPSSADLNLPTLPQSYRLRDVEVVLSGTPMDEIHLFCKMPVQEGDRRVLLSKYYVHTESWVNFCSLKP